MPIAQPKYNSEAVNLMIQHHKEQRIQYNKDFPLKEKITSLLQNLEKKIFENYIDNFFGKYKIYFITLNPPIDKSVFRKDIKDLSRKYVKDEFCYSLWNFENFTSNGERLHSHGIVIAKKKKAFKKYTKMTPSWLKGYSGFWSKRLQKNSIDYSQITDIDTLKYRIAYIHGYKRDKKKLELVDRDRTWRKERNIFDTYTDKDFKNFPSVVKYLQKLTEESIQEFNEWKTSHLK